MYKEKGYEIVKGFISKELADFLWGYFELIAYNKTIKEIEETLLADKLIYQCISSLKDSILIS